MSKLIKILGIIIQPVIGLICGDNIPDSINLNSQTYCTEFYDDLLYSTYVISDDDFIKKEGEQFYYKVPSNQFSIIACADNHSISEPALYVLESSLEDARKYYRDNNSFTYHCLIESSGNSAELCFANADADMFCKLISFCEENSYRPSGTPPEKNFLCKSFPLPEVLPPSYSFFKKSLDGIFVSSKGYALHLIDDVMYLVYQYDFDHGGTNARMWVIELPENLCSYFRGLITGKF